jgi:hypothetical protein
MQRLNDAFRADPTAGHLFATPRVVALGAGFVESAMAAIRAFTDFTPDIDPYREHDMVKVEVDGQTVYFKIAYRAENRRTNGSEDSAGENKYYRIGTIMLAEDLGSRVTLTIG